MVDKLLQGIFQVSSQAKLIYNEVFLKVYVRTMLHVVLPLYATRTIQFNNKILLQKH